ncbi:MAG TPA: hypothetical protein VMR25_03985 [Planctomycetaceae bacterium]|jgi:DNA-binding MarR family transcriptional regulator|nr:hypothetical protein [Planctomycetaceae bacterium]
MTPPSITHLQFAALSVLQDGAHRGGTSIARAMLFHNPKSFTIIIRPLAARALIERVEWTEREVRRVGYRITPAGRRVWREAVDFYAFFVSRFGAAPPVALADATDGVEPAAGRSPQGGPDRLPTPSEAEAIAAAASSRFAALFRALREGELELTDLMALRVADVDLVAGTCRVPSSRQRLRFGPGLRSIFAEEIAVRREGHIFVNNAGNPWGRNSVQPAFANARRKAGVPVEAKLCGRHGNKRRRSPLSHLSMAGGAG